MIEDFARRTYRARDGHTYRVTLAPIGGGLNSQMLGVNPQAGAIVFERGDGWIGSAPIYQRAALSALTDEEVGRYLAIAMGLG